MTTTADLDDRYGRTRSPGKVRAWWITVAIVSVSAIVWFAWGIFADANNSVRADDTAFTISDEHSVTVSFQVTAPVGASITCAIKALDEDFVIVGWRVVVYPPFASHAQAYTETIPTVGEATTGLVNSCWVT